MLNKKIYCFKRLVPVVTLLLTFSVAYPLSGIRDKQRQQAFKLYTAQEYDSALPLLRDFVFQDTTVFYLMDYFMLADIYIRQADKDSARLVISRGRSFTEKSEDDRLMKRNLEFFDSLDFQLKYQTISLKPPKLKSLESYVEIVIDTTALDSLSAPDSLFAGDSLSAPDSLFAGDSLSLPDTLMSEDSLTVDDSLSAEKYFRMDSTHIFRPSMILEHAEPDSSESDSTETEKSTP